MRRLILLGLALGVATCGQKGPLELPERYADVPPAATSMAAPSG